MPSTAISATNARHSERIASRVLIIDDSVSALAELTDQISSLPGIGVTFHLDPAQALDQARLQIFDLVLVDFNMPKMNGIEFILKLRALEQYRHVPVIMITSEPERSIRLQALEAQSTDFIGKPVDFVELRARVSNLLRLRMAQKELDERASDLAIAVDSATLRLVHREAEMIMRLAKAIEYRDCDTGDHVSRVAAISRIVAEAIGLDQEACRMIYLAAPLHDIGKIAIPDEILGKAGPLTDDERVIMRSHVEIGVRILENGSSLLLRCAESIAGGHHERWDGQGYPKGVAGLDIPVEARIVALADVFDALCSARPYKRAWSLEEAHAHVMTESGRHFDPDCVAAFDAEWPRIMAVMTLSSGSIAAAPPIFTSESRSTTGGSNTTMRQEHGNSPIPLDLGTALTLRNASELREKLLEEFEAREAIIINIPPDAEADLSFVQLIESARLHAALRDTPISILSPAAGSVLLTLQRAGFTTEMTPESRAFWLHERDTL